jgi:hypothetical protein
LLAKAATRTGSRLPQPNVTQEDIIETTDPLTISQLASLPVTIDLMTAARILGIGRTKAYQLARNDEFPCRVIRPGDLYRVSTADLLQLLGICAEGVQSRQLPRRDADEHAIASCRTVK